MLKKFCGLFLGLVVLAGSACVTPTHASSAQNIIITHIQAAGVAGAKDEFIAVHNNTPFEVEVTNWCLVNKSGVSFACFSPPENTDGTIVRYFLPAYGGLTVASEEYLAQSGYHQSAFSFIYSITNQSSGSIVGSADTITLVDQNKDIADQKSWSTALPTGKIWIRVLLLSSPAVYASANETSDWSVGDRGVVITNSLQERIEQAPPNEPEVPSDGEGPGSADDDPGGDDDGDGDSPDPVDPPKPLPLIITEIFANPSGIDTGNEFIELYNPNENDSVSLSGLRLRIGLASPKWYSLPQEIILQPLQYLAVYNRDIPFSLVNTNGGVQLYKGEVSLGDRIEYSSPKDNFSWALINNNWIYVAMATPGAANIANHVTGEGVGTATSATSQKPCAENQFRNPETGRCKLLSAATTGPTPCKAGQERNPETNRCRNITSSQKTPTPCKEGQERNPETNRCRNIIKMTNADHGVKGVQMQPANQPSWYYVAAIGAVILGILGYAVWEWRQELATLWARVRRMFAKRAG